jgi:hypothetical protein
MAFQDWQLARTCSLDSLSSKRAASNKKNHPMEQPSSTHVSKQPSVQWKQRTKHPSIDATSSAEVRAQLSKQEHELISEERSASSK